MNKNAFNNNTNASVTAGAVLTVMVVNALLYYAPVFTENIIGGEANAAVLATWLLTIGVRQAWHFFETWRDKRNPST